MSEVVNQAIPGVAPGKTEKKRCFYYSAFTEEEKAEYEQALESNGLDDEVTLLKVKIKSLAKREPDNITLIMRAINSLGRLMRIRFTVFKKGNMEQIRETMTAVFQNAGIPRDMVPDSFYQPS